MEIEMLSAFAPVNFSAKNEDIKLVAKFRGLFRVLSNFYDTLISRK